MNEVRLMVQTYLDSAGARDVRKVDMTALEQPGVLEVIHRPDGYSNWASPTDRERVAEQSGFGQPNIPVVIREQGRLEIALGTHDDEDTTKPSIEIERRANGWAIFLYPMGYDEDPSDSVYFLDDGRSFVGRGSSGPGVIRVLKTGVGVPAIDRIRRK